MSDWRHEVAAVQCEVCKDSADDDLQPFELQERSENITTCDSCDWTLCEAGASTRRLSA